MFLVSFFFAQYRCDWNVISGGSGNLTSTNFQCQATAIQTAIGSLATTNFLSFIGFWQRELETGIMEKNGEQVDNLNNLVAKLYSAKTNPFRSQTAVQYSLPAQCKVQLLVYDVSGRLVKTLINEEEVPGIYIVNWNSKNDRNQTVAAGIYFYKFQTQMLNLIQHTETKKLLLIE